MKKQLSMFLIGLLICLTVAGCGNSTPPAASSSVPEASSVSQSAEVAEKSDLPGTSPSPAADKLAAQKASYEAKLNSYIDLVLTLAVGFKEGDELFIDGNLENYEIMNAIALRAYEKGAKFVFSNCGNRLLENARAKYWTDQSYADYPYLGETANFLAAYTHENAKVIELHDYFSEDQTGASQKQLNDYPDALLAAKEAAFKGTEKARSQLIPLENNPKGFYAKSAVAVPTKVWAQKVYPELSVDAAYYQLADDIFSFMYVTEEGSTMMQQLESLEKRRNKFNEMEITSLHYSSATSDFDVPLHKNNKFASMPYRKGDDILAGNIPSMEIFALPTKYGANGTVQNTRPLVVNGSQVVDGIKMEFKDGKLINYSVEKNPEAFEALVAKMPEGVYMGEISMVSCDSPIFQTGKVYYSTLIDENAAAHFAIGSALIGSNLKKGTEIDEDINTASDHIDIVIGSKDLTVTATLKDGTKVDLIKDGQWTDVSYH